RFTPEALKACRERELAGQAGLETFITRMLSLDPRPAYHVADPTRERFGVRIFDFDLKWKLEGDEFLVYALDDLMDGSS
ncbi:MAG: hypothetical protein ABIK28_15145, partial [Planctomycetota bacterium]